MNSPDDIILVILHPHGTVETTLSEWMKTGPGPRDLLRPLAARDAKTGQSLTLDVIPLRYRNTSISRTLIKLGILKNPWPADDQQR
jgi:hypothetical protein